MSEIQKPRNVKAHPPVNRDQAHAIAAGLGVVRKPLFAMPISHDGWQKQMLTHIGAAKALGFTMFEIDTVECTVPRPKKKKEPATGSMFSSMYILYTEGEEWKAKESTESDSEETDGTMRTTMVCVFALAVE